MTTICVHCRAPGSMNSDHECSNCYGGNFWLGKQLLITGLAGGLSRGDLVTEQETLWKVNWVDRDIAILRRLRWYERMRMNLKRLFKRRKRHA